MLQLGKPTDFITTTEPRALVTRVNVIRITPEADPEVVLLVPGFHELFAYRWFVHQAAETWLSDTRVLIIELRDRGENYCVPLWLGLTALILEDLHYVRATRTLGIIGEPMGQAREMCRLDLSEAVLAELTRILAWDRGMVA